MRFFRGGAAEERRAVHDGIHALHRRRQRVRLHQVAGDQVDAVVRQVGRTGGIAHQGTHGVSVLHQSLGESAAYFSGRAGHEYVHAGHGSRRMRDGIGKNGHGPAGCSAAERPTTMQACPPILPATP